jgi:protein-tyrosine phosphatase
VPSTSILIVCTGNICRSPTAEGLLLKHLRAAGEDDVAVASAGTDGCERMPATREAVRAAATRGADISSHRGRCLAVQECRDATLVLAMTGQHRDEVLRLVPEAADRTFTLKELVSLLEALPADAVVTMEAETIRSRIAAASAIRRSGAAPRIHDEDVTDPIGMSQATYDAIAWELDGLLSKLVHGLLEAEPSESAPRGSGATGSSAGPGQLV